MGNDFQKLEDTLGKFSTISLKDMDTARLMNRIDTKYVFHAERLPEILDKAFDPYRILSINDRRIFKYHSLYFDTSGLLTYFDHHNGIRPRYKVRFREYEDTDSIYLEVKRKISSDRTRKSRILVDSIEQELSEKSAGFITEKSPLDPAELQPSLQTIFRRFTLVGNGSPERITLDIDLSFRQENKETTLPFLCICEVKRPGASGSSDFMKILKANYIYPRSSSKYCLGTILLNEGIKYNRFKSLILYINKLENVYRSSLSASQPA